jgi:predicted dehydrogenase
MNGHTEPAVSHASPVTLIIVGAGQRGRNYAKYALNSPDQCSIVAVAEPRPKARARLAAEHALDAPRVFHTWRDLHAASTEAISASGGKRIADAVVVAVQDSMHLEVVQAFAEQGYHILCEKPMATSIEDCLKIYDIIKKADIIFGMGHGAPRSDLLVL